MPALPETGLGKHPRQNRAANYPSPPSNFVSSKRFYDKKNFSQNASFPEPYTP